MKIDHKRIGMLTEDQRDIACYVHERHAIGVCEWCDFIRVENITNEFIDRLNQVPGIRHLYMWSLGSSLSDTKMNRKLMLRRWHLFRLRMNRSTSWTPVFRIIEVGKRGFLHFHFVATSFIDHRIVLNAWRSLTREKSNVHVSGYKGDLKPSRLARYLMKYLTKTSSQYRWMGAFYGLNKETSRKVSNVNDKLKLIYGGEVYGGFSTNAVVVQRERQKRIITKDDN